VFSGTDPPRPLISVFYVRFEVFTAFSMKNGVLRDVALCGSCKSPTFRKNLAPPSSG
jgi:hypothetical protein